MQGPCLARHPWKLTVLAGVVVAAGCIPFPGNPNPFVVGDNLQAQYLAQDATGAAALAVASDGRLFFTERTTGRIRVIADGKLQDQAFAQVPVNYAGSRGLIGIALHPGFPDNPRVYVFYSRSDTGSATNVENAIVDHRVVYFNADGNTASGSEVFITTIPFGPSTGRIGGRISFARDGTLLIGVGDNGDEAAPQNTASLLGKVLRLNDDGTLPSNNPTPGSAIYAVGFRDPGGFAVDVADASVWVLDRNPPVDDKISPLTAGGNYGWPIVAGTANETAELNFVADNATFVPPILTSAGKNAQFAGVALNPSTKYGGGPLRGLFYGDASRSAVEWAQFDNTRTAISSVQTFASGFPGTLTDVVFSAAGSLYVGTNTDVFIIETIR